jgi:hypothetical protein
MKSITANPAGTKIAYLVETSSGSSIYLSNFDGSGRERIYSSALSEWLLQWPDAAALSLTSKPSADVPGYLYSLTPSGSFVRQFGNISGMTTLTSPDRKEVLYAQSTAGVFSLNTFVRATGERGEAPVTTLPEKCVWSKDHVRTLYCGVPKNVRSSTYPDAWYQGLLSFSDDIWVIDLAMGSANVIATPVETAGEEIDLINPMLSPDEHYLIFMNKKDSSLWSLRLVSES